MSWKRHLLLKWLLPGLLTALSACGDERVLAFTTANTNAGVEDPPVPSGCRLGTDDCGAQAKCTVMRGEDGALVASCAPAGSVAVGMACSRATLGVDDCLDSLCSPLTIPEPSPQPVCRQLCSQAGACGPAERCLDIEPQSGQLGVCLPECQVPVDDCGGGLHCSVVTDVLGQPFGMCSEVGPVMVGGACRQMTDCASGLGCESMSQTCRPFCDGAEDCAAPLECVSLGFEELPNLGLCL